MTTLPWSRRRLFFAAPDPRWVAAAAVIIAAAIVYAQIDARSFWLDEAQSVALTRHWSRLPLTIARGGGNFALYYLMLHEWLRFGETETWIRTLSVIPALATIPLIFMLGRRLFDEWTGALAALALGVHPLFIEFACTARGYSLLVLAATASTYFLVVANAEPRRAWPWIGYVAAGTVGAYTQVLFVLVLAVHALWFAGVERRVGVLRKGGLTAIALVALLAPLAVLANRVGTHFLTWISPVTIADLRGAAVLLFGSRPALLLAIGLCLVALARGYRPTRAERSRWLLLILWLLLPLTVLFAYSVLRQPVLVDRYLIVSIPAACLLAAATAVCCARGKWLTAAAAVVLLVGLSADVAKARAPQAEDWRGVVSFLASHARTSDPLLIRTGVVKRAYDYAVERAGVAGRMPLFVDEPGRIFADRRAVERLLRRVADAHPCVWLILSHQEDPGDPPGSALMTADVLRSIADPVETQKFGVAVSVTAYRTRTAGADACDTRIK